MSNLRLTYNHPWLLLLIIPFLLLTLLPYFRLDKKYRATRNRIISMVLHTVVCVIAANLLAGVSFSYEVPNEENEIILLVDTSDSSSEKKAERDEFVGSVIDVSGDGCKIGIVKFGYGYKLAVEPTLDKTGVYEKYLASEDPDGSATALEDALEYTATLFENRECGKIVVISDGIETDGDALGTLGSLVSSGISIDCAYFGADGGEDIKIVSAVYDSEDAVVGESFGIEITVESNSTENEEAALLRLRTDGKDYGEAIVSIKNGTNVLPVSIKLEGGVHELEFELVTDYELFGEPLGDGIAKNNVYRTYVNLEVFKNVLLIERHEGEGNALKEIISESKKVTDISVEQDIELFPKTIKKLAEFEEVVLVNIAYSDMPDGFEELLHKYVYELGGGLFTVGGENDEIGGKPIPHAYNRADIENSTYFKDMLPVNAEDYTPPVAVMIVVDTSTSMQNKLEEAADGAIVCLDALHDRDFCGVMSFASASSERLAVLPVSQDEAIREAITKLKDEKGGGTMFSDAIMKAGRALSVITNVERKHIILVTDGMPNDSYEDYSKYISDNNSQENKITMSVITIGLDRSDWQATMQNAATLGGGKYYNVDDAKSLSSTMHTDLTQKVIPEIAYGREFPLTVKDRSTILTGIDKTEIPTLSGYYGTVAKKDATVPLMGEYVPIYAFHKYGAGTVGSFMCDLGGKWSENFVSSDAVVGRAIITNIVQSIMPHTDVRADDIKYELKADNYSYQLTVHGAKEGERVSVSVEPLSAHLNNIEAVTVTQSESGRRFNFFITEAGLYEIRITVLNDVGDVVCEIPIYEAFSYSREYGGDMTAEDGAARLALIAKEGDGRVIGDPANVLLGFATTLTKTYDPRVILIITAIIAFLLDIAVRKFKFKWIHELIRERKLKK